MYLADICSELAPTWLTGVVDVQVVYDLSRRAAVDEHRRHEEVAAVGLVLTLQLQRQPLGCVTRLHALQAVH